MAVLAQTIAAHRDEILRQWLEGARRAASARSLRGPELTDMIPEYVAALGRSTSGESPTPEQRRLIEIHLSQRLRQGFDVSEVLVEFSILARAIHDVMDGLPPQERPPEQEQAHLFKDLHAATDVISRIFSEHLLEDEQLEKRYARLIQDVVSDAVRSGNALPVRERIDEILALVREALGADAAALMLYDAGSDRLIMTASTGFAAGAIDEVAAVTRSTLVGQVALEPAGVLMVDSEATSLELGAPLRQAGIRSLLGVRLSAAQTLFGVLYVGTRSQREFTPGDIRRLESLGDRITLHLENAQLSARLRDQIDQLELFVDVLAHDLLGPLTTARLAVTMLRDEAADRVSATNRLDRSLRRLERMVTDLLDAHRVAAGQPLPLHIEGGDVGHVVADAVDELDAPSRTRVVVRGDGMTQGAFDLELVRRAIWNLVVNGLKYGDPESPVIVEVRGDEHGFVVAVHNEGNPIPAAQRAQIFTPFARARAASEGPAARQGPSGWGLGLSLVAGCANAHGGSVAVDSDAGGTTFRLTVPWQVASCARPALPLH